jgi:hypothetical protein
MKTLEEINQVISQLNEVGKTLKRRCQTVSIGDYIAHAHTITTLLWVLGEVPTLPILDLYGNLVDNQKSGEQK